MGTTINITVGGNGLLDQSRQQVQANRFGKLERDQDAKAEQEAGKQRENQRQATEPKGQPPRQRQYKEEPAANRRSGTEVTLSPVSDYINYALAAKVKGTRPLNFVHQFDYPVTSAPEGLRQFVFAPGAGPSSTTALTMPEPPANTTYFDTIQARFYIADQNPITAYELDGDNIFGLVSGAWLPLTSSRKFGQLKQWTLEGFIRAGSVDPGGGNQALSSQGGIAVNGIGMYFYYDQYSVTPGVTTRDWKLYLDVPGSAPVTLTYAIGAFAFGSWVHLAAVKSGNEIKVYLNGTAVATISLTPAYNAQVDQELIRGTVSADINSSVLAGPGGGGLTFTVPAVHGYRFTTRVRYAANFTPPIFIA